MTDRRHLIQDLRAEAHTAPGRAGQLMRDAANMLESDAELAEPLEARVDFDQPVTPIPFPPPRIGSSKEA